MAPGPGWRVSAYVSGGNDDPAGCLTPAEEQAQGDDDEGEGKSYPGSVDAPMQDEAEGETEGQAEDPVADEVGDHGRACFSQSAQSAGADSLNSIEDLECRGDP